VSTDATDFSDALAEKAITLVFRFLPEAYADGNNLLAREKMHNASCLAGMAFNSAGLGITHSLAHAIGGKLHISHGRSNAIILPYIVEYNSKLKKNGFTKEYERAAKKYQRLARILDLHATTVPIGVNNFIQSIVKLQKTLMIATDFKQLGADVNLAQGLKEEIIDAAMKDICTTTNPTPVTSEEMSALFDKIMGAK
jgi:alcohol dehydrogenase class IV